MPTHFQFLRYQCKRIDSSVFYLNTFLKSSSDKILLRFSCMLNSIKFLRVTYNKPIPIYWLVKEIISLLALIKSLRSEELFSSTLLGITPLECKPSVGRLKVFSTTFLAFLQKETIKIWLKLGFNVVHPTYATNWY